jgi:rhamnosyl/mannosyltransferase
LTVERRLKVLQVYRTFFPDTQGGAEETIRQIAVGISKLDCECRIFVPSFDPTPEELLVSNIPVIRKKMHFEIASCGFALGSLREFRRQVEWADVVHYHFPWPFADLLDWVADVKKPKVVTYHSDIVRQKSLMRLYRPLMMSFLSSAVRVVATSEQYASSSSVLHQLDNVEVIPIGVDEISYPQPSDQMRSAMSEKYGTGYFFFVGMLRYYKGLHILLEACVGADFQVVIAGVGPEEAALRRQAERLELDNVVFIGRVDDSEKMALIDNSIGLVFPSHLRSEAFGVTLVEGLMRSKPLITAEVGTGTSFVNANGETGYVVEPKNSKALREAMNKLNDESVASALGRNGRTRYESLLTAELMARSYRNLYNKLTSPA